MPAAAAVARGKSPARTGSPARSASPPTKAGTPAKKTPQSTPLKGGAAAAKGGGAAAGAKKRPPAAPKAGEFIASKKWDGPRTGMAFRSGPFGQGYYADPNAPGGSSASAPAAVGGGGAAHTPASAASSERELDAADVFATLPISMQVAFEARDVNALDAALAALDPAEAEVHMARCINSGLWDPGAGGGGGGGGSGQEQEPSPTGESDAPSSANSSPNGGGAGSSSAAASPGAPDVSEEEAAAHSEAWALEARARQAQEAASEAEGAAPATGGLFERGPYRNGGPQTDAPSGGGAAAAAAAAAASQQAGKRPPIGKGKAAAAAEPPKPKAAAAAAGARGGSSSDEALRHEQQARAHFEAELAKAQTQVDRLRSKLDDAEKFKSDEARAMQAANATQKRLQAENETLRRLLAEAGVPLPAELSSEGGAAASEAAAAGASAATMSAFDAPVKPAEEASQISFPPASLDPDEVLLSLPQTMQDAFDALDVAALHASLAALPPAEASEYMRRCVASGLWDPNGGGGGVDAS